MIFGNEENFNFYEILKDIKLDTNDILDTNLKINQLFGENASFNFYNSSNDFELENYETQTLNTNDLNDSFNSVFDETNFKNYNILENDIELCHFQQNNCSNIRIGNDYGAYEIERKFCSPQLYARDCPCKTPCEHKKEEYSSKNEKHSCDKSNLSQRLTFQVCKDLNELDYLMSCLIETTKCPHKKQCLLQLKQTTNKLNTTMFSVSKILCFCEPICKQTLENENQNIYAKMLLLLSHITQNLLKLQSICENKLISVTLSVVLLEVFKINNQLLQLVI